SSRYSTCSGSRRWSSRSTWSPVQMTGCSACSVDVMRQVSFLFAQRVLSDGDNFFDGGCVAIVQNHRFADSERDTLRSLAKGGVRNFVDISHMGESDDAAYHLAPGISDGILQQPLHV